MHKSRFQSNLGSALALAILGMLALALFAQSKALAQSEQPPNKWSRPIPISRGLPGSWYPSIAVTDNGLVTAIWTATQDNQNTIYLSQNNGIAWSRPIDILIGGLHADLRLDGRNMLHLMYGDLGNVYVSDARVENASTAKDWNQPLKVSRQAAVPGDVTIAPDGTLHAVWLEKSDKDTAQAVYGQSQDGGESWSRYRAVGEDALDKSRVRITRNLTGTLYSIWSARARDNRAEGVALNVSENNGETWLDNPRTLAFDDEPIRQPALAVDKNNALVLVYNFGVKDESFFQVSTDDGKTWTDQKPIPGLFAANPATGNDYFALATDSSGLVHLIAVGRNSKDQKAPGIYHTTWDGTTWSEPEEIYRQNTFIEFPDIAIANGNQLHVVFSTRDLYRVSGAPDSSYQVWYANLQTNAPAATLQPLQTFTPKPSATTTPQATAEPTRRPSATPFPTGPEDSTSSSDSPNPYLPILTAVLPVVLIVAVVLLTSRAFRRRR